MDEAWMRWLGQAWMRWLAPWRRGSENPQCQPRRIHGAAPRQRLHLSVGLTDRCSRLLLPQGGDLPLRRLGRMGGLQPHFLLEPRCLLSEPRRLFLELGRANLPAARHGRPDLLCAISVDTRPTLSSPSSTPQRLPRQSLGLLSLLLPSRLSVLPPFPPSTLSPHPLPPRLPLSSPSPSRHPPQLPLCPLVTLPLLPQGKAGLPRGALDYRHQAALPNSGAWVASTRDPLWRCQLHVPHRCLDGWLPDARNV